MRILICAPDTPFFPVNNGLRRQLVGLLSELGQRHDVRLLGYRHPDQSSAPAVEAEMRVVPYEKPDFAANAHDFTSAMLRRRPLRASRFVKGLRRPLRESLAGFEPDVVHVSSAKLAELEQELAGRPRVLMALDAWHLNADARADAATGLRGRFLRADAKRIRRFEETQYRGFDRIVFCNERDRDEIRAQDPTLRFEVIPIGFDADAYASDPNAVVDRSRIIFHGAMGYAPNVRAAEYLARDIYPRVLAARPEARLVLVGRDPAPRVLELGTLPGVDVIGPVDDMRAWLTGSRVWVGPLLDGTGMKNKLLEAMAAELPCVVTPLAHQGHDVVSGEQLLVGSTEDELAAHVIRVLSDDDLAARLGRAGGDYVRPRYGWPAIARAYEELYEAVLSEHARNGSGGS